MKKMMILALALAVFSGIAMAQVVQGSYGPGTTGTPIPLGTYDKLGAHQNGGRGCVGCHAPHSGARGNGGNVAGLTYNTTTQKWEGTFVDDKSNQGDETLWGQDLGPIYNLKSIQTGNNAAGYVVDLTEATMPERVKTGIVMCLSCHDGSVAKGAMMTNQSFEQAAGLLPATYGSQPIPTLLGDDGGAAGNYTNDHPIGTQATIGKLGVSTYFQLDSATAPTKVTQSADANYAQFITNYANPIGGARTGAGWAVPEAVSGSYDVKNAYVVCTSCHTPHTMYTSKVGSNVYPSFFFISAPYNPSADTANGTKASSATQFCRSCHFTGAGGSNEGSGIYNVKTAY